MKANEPERIWIDNLDEGFWFDSPSGNKSIEYIRKDAFINKACSWLENNLQGIVGGSIYMEDFRKYMKGE